MGILVRLEVGPAHADPEEQSGIKELVSQVFTFDYIGALLASVIFPLLQLHLDWIMYFPHVRDTQCARRIDSLFQV